MNSTLNGYHVIATALATGAGLADVLHTTGNETKTGSLTFLSDTSIVVSAANPILEGRNTANAQYRWRIYLPNSDNKVYFQHNTHASGDFSTSVNAMSFNETTMTYTGTIVAAAATLSTELVTKAQLDAKVYGGRIANNGTASVTYGPSGWTVSRTAAGTVVITHNLGTTNYTIVASPYLASFRLTPSVINANDVTIITWNTADVAQDSGFNFTLARN